MHLAPQTLNIVSRGLLTRVWLGVYTCHLSRTVSLQLPEAVHHHASSQTGRIPGHD